MAGVRRASAWMGIAAVLASGTWLQAQAPVSSPPVAVPLSALPIQVTGIMLDSDPAKVACLVRCAGQAGRSQLRSIGIVACDAAVVREIRPDGVVVFNQDMQRLEWLGFSSRTAAPAPPAADPAQQEVAGAAPPVTVVALPKTAVEQYLTNLPELLQSALASPRFLDGPGGQRTIGGYEIGQVRPGGAADRLGLQNGDVITEVNGLRLDGLAAVMRLFGEFGTMTQARVTVLRNGQPLTVVVRIK